MPKFHYKAVRSDGEPMEGTVLVPDRFAVYAEVRKSSATVLSVEEIGTGLRIDLKRFHIFLDNVKQSDKIIFARNLGAMIGAGLPLSRGLSVLERQTKNTNFKEVLSALSNDIKRGISFHESMEGFPKVFPKLFTAMVKAGEESGKLGSSLLVVAEQTERAYNLTKKIRGAMIYPGVIFTAMIAIGITMLVVVIPTLSATFASFDVELPLPTRMVIGTSNFILHYWYVILISVAAFTAFFLRLVKTVRGKHVIENILLRSPVIGTIMREVNAARTARTLSSLLSSGVEIISGLEITSEVVQNSHFKAVIDEARGNIEKGNPIASVFTSHEDLYPPLVGELIAVGEETGQLPAMLLQVAVFYENEVEQKTKNMTTVIEPFLMIFIGLGVGFFAISVISPIYSLSGAI